MPANPTRPAGFSAAVGDHLGAAPAGVVDAYHDAFVDAFEALALATDPYHVGMRAALDRAAAEKYVMVGDDYEADVEAARAAGFVPIHYEDEGTDFFAILRTFL